MENLSSTIGWQVALGCSSLAAASVIGASVAYSAFQGKWEKLHLLPIDLNNQSLVLDEEEGIRGSPLVPNGEYSTCPADGVATVYDCFASGMRISDNNPCIGWRKDDKSPYQWITYKETHQLAHALGSAIVGKFGLKPRQETFVCICARNCKEWILAQYGCVMFSLVIVPLYETLGLDASCHILDQTASELLFYESDSKFRQFVAQQTTQALSKLRYVVVFDAAQEATKQIMKEKCPEAEIFSLEEILEYGRNHLLEVQLPKSEDLYSICYTSGTTGSPKGVMILHGNLTSCLSGNIVPVIQHQAIRVSSETIHFSYLPLAHMFEQLAQACVLVHGGRIGIFRGDIRGLMEDIVELKPTFLCAVPRILNRIYDKVMMKANASFVSRFLMQRAIRAKLDALKRGYRTEGTIWDKLIFDKIRDILGGKVEILIIGSAPVAVEVKELFMALYGSQFFEGYGQTEATAAVSCTLPGDWTTGHVGCVSPCCHVKLADVPDMGLNWRRDGKGEVCVRGPICTPGYLKMPDKKKELYDEEGWLHTGDIGMWMPNGTLKIVDRCKNIFKLAQGEYISPEKVELFLLQSPYVSQMCVDGNSLHSFCVAVVVPEYENLLSPDDFNDREKQMALCRDEDGSLKQKILQSFTEIGKKGKLFGFEMVKDIYISLEPFTIANDLLTPTMKVKRSQVRERFAAQLNKLYTLNGSATQ